MNTNTDSVLPVLPDVMVDLETLGTTPGCVILQIGACRFCSESGAVGEPVEFGVSLLDSIREGFRIDPETLAWWLRQPAETWEAVTSGLLSPGEAWMDFSDWCRAGGPIERVWCKGASFDFPLLECLQNRAGGESPRMPWRYTQERCFRTLQAVHDPEKMLEPVRPAEAVGFTPQRGEGAQRLMRHLAGADAQHQAEWAVSIFEGLTSRTCGTENAEEREAAMLASVSEPLLEN